MSNFISGFCFIRVAMLRMCVGLLFVGLVVAAHTVQSKEDFFAPALDILTIQLARPDIDWLLPYQLNANVALPRLAHTMPVWYGFNDPSRLHLITEPEKEAVQVTSANGQQTYDSYRISLQRLLSLEFKGDQTSIAFQPSAIVIQREQVRFTFRSQSALIETDQFKVLLQPHSASVLWNKMF